MKFNQKKTPREFKVGTHKKITIKDHGTIELGFDDQVTFIIDGEKQYDVVRKKWGFYATPSVNKRLKSFGFKTALVKNQSNNNIFILIVDEDRIADFYSYIKSEKMNLVEWLDEKK